MKIGRFPQLKSSNHKSQIELSGCSAVQFEISDLTISVAGLVQFQISYSLFTGLA